MIVLQRITNDTRGTLGILSKDNKPLCYTLELPYLNNRKNISSIPEGVYNVIRVNSKRYGHCFMLRDVPNRTDILIHAGNSIGDTKGCILVGSGSNLIDRTVIFSRDTLRNLRDSLPQSFNLIVRNKNDEIS